MDALSFLAAGFIVIYGISFALKANYAIRIANNMRPYDPPPRMVYKEGKVHFLKISQTECWWITFWKYL